MSIDRPQVRLAMLPTPIEAADRLAASLGMSAGSLLVKRDDLTGIGGGGTKVRRLEHLCADALANHCDVLVAGGRPQSNHVRLSAAVANRLGLECVAVLGGSRPQQASGNMLLTHILAARQVWSGAGDFAGIERAVDAEVERLRAEGHRPFALPMAGRGGSGGLGYVAAAHEILAEVPDVGLVVVASGSGTTQAGLAVGLGDHSRVLGIDVGGRPDLADAVSSEAVALAAHASLPSPKGRATIDRTRFGAAQGEITDDGVDAIRLAARTDGLLLDPTYTGKAMAGLIAARSDGAIEHDTRVVFLHTGGLPILFAASYAGRFECR